MSSSTFDINEIRALVTQGDIVWRNHVLMRMRQRKIKIKDVINCILSGKAIEYYYEDYPYTSCLVLGYSVMVKGLHAVCALGENKVWMITTYYPDKDEWNKDLKTRRR